MSADLLVSRWTRPVRARALARDLLLSAPLAIVAAAAGWRFAGLVGALLGLAVAAAAIAITVVPRLRRFDRRWLIATLDASGAGAEDSSDLLFADPAGLGPLQRLQRHRIEARLADEAPRLVPPASPRWPIAIWLAALAIAAALIGLPAADDPAALAPSQEGLPPAPGVSRLTGQRLLVIPPAYTGLPPRPLATLDARVPAGSRLRWTLAFAPEPTDAAIVPLNGGRVALRAQAGLWQAERRAERSLLYRVVPGGPQRGPVPPLHRIDVVPDRPPIIRVLTPAATLDALRPGQRRWQLAFEVADDHAVRATATLRLTVAQGEGENVRFSSRTLTLQGSGPAKRRRFAATVDIAGLGFTDPGDLVAQLTAADTRTPAPQEVRGPSLILRRAAPRPEEGGGLEAMVRRQLPAYFRSQRQIIIDTEALIAERARLTPAAFMARAEGIGEDQRLLRLRYGQFMGEETGGGASAAMPTNDAEDGDGHDDEHGAAAPHSHDDGHDHGAPGSQPGFGSDLGVVESYGHTHDESEAATLLDPGTRATLRKALDAMWDAERALRQGELRTALPPENRALRFIKQIQQAERIYLARTGTQQPPLDPTRRLTGDRDDLARQPIAATNATPIDAVPGAIWKRLGEGQDPAALDDLARWLRGNERRLADPLALAGALDQVRRDPGCAACRQRLRALLWTALPRPEPGLARRAPADAVGRRYLGALR